MPICLWHDGVRAKPRLSGDTMGRCRMSSQPLRHIRYSSAPNGFSVCWVGGLLGLVVVLHRRPDLPIMQYRSGMEIGGKPKIGSITVKEQNPIISGHDRHVRTT
jgi:hypothetical protein